MEEKKADPAAYWTPERFSNRTSTDGSPTKVDSRRDVSPCSTPRHCRAAIEAYIAMNDCLNVFVPIVRDGRSGPRARRSSRRRRAFAHHNRRDGGALDVGIVTKEETEGKVQKQTRAKTIG